MNNKTENATIEIQPQMNPFDFQDHEVRTAMGSDGKVWFCASDACRALDILWQGAGNNLRNMPEGWVSTYYYQGKRGGRDIVFISEPALYRLAFRSNKPAAITFANWVCEEVLPAIRRNGFFGQIKDDNQWLKASDRLIKLYSALEKTETDAAHSLLYQVIVHLGNILGIKVPPRVDFKTHRQIEMFSAPAIAA